MTSLPDAVAAAVAEFGPRAEQRYPVYVSAPVGEEVITAEEMLAPETLPEFFVRAGAIWGPDVDLVAASSRFMRRYCGSVTSAALIPLSQGLAIDVSLPRVTFVIRDGMPQGVVVDLDHGRAAASRQRPYQWPVETEMLASFDAVRQRALHSMFGDNLVLAFKRVNEEIHLSRRVMWTTQAEQIDALYESAFDAGDPTRRAMLVEDRTVLLHGAELPGVPGPNPLLDKLEWGEPTNTRAGRVIKRKFCCVNYVIPDRFGANDAHCSSCPLLTPEQRKVAIQEQQTGVG